jgi:archaellum component FlaC
MYRRIRLIVCLIMVSFLSASFVWAQQPTSNAPPAETLEQREVLLGILKSIGQIERDMQRLQNELRSPDSEGTRDELRKQLQQQRAKLEALRKNFGDVASGVDVTDFTAAERSDINWQERLLELLRPFLNELTRLTAGPREIEQLRTRITDSNNQLRTITQGVANITQLMGEVQDETLRASLKQLKSHWQTWQQEVDTQLQIANQQLQRKLDEQPSIQESVKQLLQLFFRSRGRNFVVACAAFLGLWLILHRLHGILQKLPFLHRERRSFSRRLFNVTYTMLTVACAIFGFLLVLYIYKDWVLLTLSIFFLVGIAWTSKETLPRFVREVMLLLNVGAVREGERVVYNGIPWLVRTLNLHTSLVNPELAGGQLHLPLRDFHTLRSRPFKPDEPWFPTRLNDWVLLSDETLGKVVIQTPEIVRLVLLGGSQRTLNTTDFLAQSPNVLSTGFRLEVTFGIDYQHQAIITDHIPAQLTAALHDALCAEGHDQHLVHLSVEFAEAGASSLDLNVLADFSGDAASRYYLLRRAIQRICVDTCNAYAWVIPFAQLTLHMAAPVDNPSQPLPDGVFHDRHRTGKLREIPEQNASS